MSLHKYILHINKHNNIAINIIYQSLSPGEGKGVYWAGQVKLNMFHNLCWLHFTIAYFTFNLYHRKPNWKKKLAKNMQGIKHATSRDSL